MQNVLSFGGKNAVKEAILYESIVRPKDAGDQLVTNVNGVVLRGPQVAGGLLAKPR